MKARLSISCLICLAWVHSFPQMPAARRMPWVSRCTKLQALKTLYPEVSPFNNGTIAVDSIHTIFYQEYGNQNGIPALFLHGGPGAGCFPRHAQFFDPNLYRIILLDQRGSGQSIPRGEIQNNTLLHLVQDCETLRATLNIDRWGVVLGGSWGSTLALAYAQEHPTSVQSLILRGVCLLRSAEVDWLFATGMALEHPKAWKEFQHAANISDSTGEPRDVLHAYYDRLLSSDPEIQLAAAKSWMTFEMQVSRSAASKQNASNTTDVPIVLVGRPLGGKQRAWGFRTPVGELLPPELAPTQPRKYKESLRKNISQALPLAIEQQASMRSIQPVMATVEEDAVEANATGLPKEYATYIPAQAMLTCFYSVNDRYAMNHLNLLDRMDRIEHIPCIAVHGGQDHICPIDTALDVAQQYPRMELRVPIAAGHSMYDPDITNELVRATDRLAASFAIVRS